MGTPDLDVPFAAAMPLQGGAAGRHGHARSALL
jgi:hypothetical protein